MSVRFTLVAALSACTVAHAADATATATPPAAPAAHAANATPMAPESGGLVGLAVLHAPRYAGSDEQRTRALPLLDYRWANGWFAGTRGIGFNASGTPGLSYGPRLTFDGGRKERHADALRGMGDIDARAELGGFVTFAATDALSLEASLAAGSGDGGRGVRLELGASYAFALGQGRRLSLGAGTTLANQDYVQSYFGVTPAQAQRSGYAVYTPKAGAVDSHLKAALSWPLAPRVMLTAAVTASRLQTEAKASPLVRKASATRALLGVGYAF